MVEDTTKEIRPYIVCFIVRDVDLKAPKYKQFIQAQTRLHDSICERRNAATIATHDLAKIPKGTVCVCSYFDRVHIVIHLLD